MTRVRIDAVEDRGNTADGSVWIRRTTHIDGGVYTASSALGGGGGSLSLSAGTSSAALGSVVFSNSNNVSFGLNGSTVTGSVLPPGGVSAGTASVQLGTVVFSNSNNVSFGLNGSTVTASATVASTAGSISVSAGTSSANLGSVVFSNSNGVSFGLNGSTVTASVATALTSQSNQAVSAANGSYAFQTLSLSDANGISFGTSAGSAITASHNALTSQSNQAASASNGSFTFQTLNFSNANNVTFGTSAGGIVTASVAAPGGGGSATFSAGTSSAALASLVFSDSNGLAFGLNGSTITGSYTVPSLAGYLTAINLSAGTTNSSHSAFSFANSNGFNFGINGRTITGSQNATGVNMTGGTSGEGGSAWSFVNTNGISWQVIGGGGTNTIQASHNGLTSQSNQAASASNGSFTFQTLNFSNANNVTFGTSAGGVITASVAAGGANSLTFLAGTSTATLMSLVFQDANNVSFGLNGSTVTASASGVGGGGGITALHWPFEPWPIATSTVNLGTTGGTGGSTQITASMHVCPFVIPVAIQYGAVLMPVSFATVAGTGSVTMGHNVGLYTLNGNTLSRVTSWMWGARISQNSVTAQSWNWWYGTDSTANTDSRGGNVSATFARLADIVLTDKTTATMNAGQYFLVAAYTRRSSNAAVWGTAHRGQYSVSQFTAAAIFGSNTSRAPLHYLNGVATVTTNVAGVTAAMMPASFATSIITYTAGTSQNQWPVIKLVPGL